MTPTPLLIAPCTRDAARHAVEHWHYSHAMPQGKLVHFGVWEDGRFVGAVVYGRGANDVLLRPYGLTQSQGCELVRVALRSHATPVSQIVAQTTRRLHETQPGLRLVVSFADPERGHHGGIYQAGNWLYLGTSIPSDEWVVHGKRLHGRNVSSWISAARGERAKRPNEGRQEWLRRTIDPNARRILPLPKFRYVLPLDRGMRRKLLPYVKPYPSPLDRAVEASLATRSASG